MGNKLEKLGVFEQGGRAVVSSRDVADIFEKEHDKVLRRIRKLSVSEDFRLANFGESSYTNDQNKQQPEFLLTRDGFTIVVMGYTGEKAVRFKEDYIAAFNKMEAKLKSSTGIEELIENPQVLLTLLTKHIETKKENERLQLTAAKYEGQTDTVGLYKIGEIAEELGVSAVKLNNFLKDLRVQYKPNGSETWRLYSRYLGNNIAFPKLVKLRNGYELPMLLWTPKGRDFIFDLVEKETPSWYA